jgi:hypothetical protein
MITYRHFQQSVCYILVVLCIDTEQMEYTENTTDWINMVMFCPPVIVNPPGEPYLTLGFFKFPLLQTIILYVFLNVLLMLFLSGSNISYDYLQAFPTICLLHSCGPVHWYRTNGVHREHHRLVVIDWQISSQWVYRVDLVVVRIWTLNFNRRKPN